MVYDLRTFNRLTATSAIKEQAQQELKDEGYYHSDIDGKWGPLSEGAWGRWLKDHIAPTSITPAFTAGLVIDINHNNDFNAERFKAAGGVAVIHKASQGRGFKDPAYHDRKAECAAAGLEFGTYHFSSGHPWAAQLDNFLDVVGTDVPLTALDWEDSTDGTNNMNVTSAAAWCQALHDHTGVWCGVYGNSLIREGVGFDDRHPVLCNAWLWLCDFRSMYKDVPLLTWPQGPTLWQFGEDKAGVDLNRFAGNAADFLTAWNNNLQLPSVV